MLKNDDSKNIKELDGNNVVESTEFSSKSTYRLLNTNNMKFNELISHVVPVIAYKKNVKADKSSSINKDYSHKYSLDIENNENIILSDNKTKIKIKSIHFLGDIIQDSSFIHIDIDTIEKLKEKLSTVNVYEYRDKLPETILKNFASEQKRLGEKYNDLASVFENIASSIVFDLKNSLKMIELDYTEYTKIKRELNTDNYNDEGKQNLVLALIGLGDLLYYTQEEVDNYVDQLKNIAERFKKFRRE
ncbi:MULTISPECIES: hypothetical protein [unclassified Granulicatella]|uniref:hypothetical protein n=1 Tax=unclassified Granulicatella TaxID=2630493 RepID=UPI00107477AD|nr:MULTISPECIES: hypothetical protein [unclassified Granulicatella]MBF0779802.1 hypothetical protein [Granulicatella sp. 19428wC4_WM01]TFU96204.1 hypothetical protein E4T68_01720 [Granulicatella sp. WM01]